MTLLVPTARLNGLTDSQNELVGQLTAEMSEHRADLDIRHAYYSGQQRIAMLGISVPASLAPFRTIVGWPRVVVDALEECLDVEGFRFSNEDSSNDDLWDIWQRNNMDEQSQLGHLEAMISRHAYAVVGVDDKRQPLITVESPRCFACQYDPRTRQITAALRVYTDDRRDYAGTLYLPDVTLTLERDDLGDWYVAQRDDHGLGQVPVVRLANRPSIDHPEGSSEITSEVISITDAACRAATAMELAREFYATPQRYILGATESDFTNPDGTPRDGWSTYMGRLLALERDEDGNVPTVGQFDPSNPAAFTQVIEMYAKTMISITGLPAEYFGVTTTNPASADAIRLVNHRKVIKARRKQRSFGGAWEQVMRLALLVRDGNVPAEAAHMETIWRNPEIPTPTATSQAILAQAQAGAVTPWSDVVLEELGYTALQRKRLEADRKQAAGNNALATIVGQVRAATTPTNTPPTAQPGTTGGVTDG